MYISKIGRRINTITCYGHRLKDNEFVNYSGVVVTTENLPTLEDVTKHLRKKEHDETIIINKVDVDRGYYRMTVDDFMKYAERTD